MTPLHQHYLTESRREFLKHTGAGIGALGLASVLNDRLFAAPAAGGQGDPLVPGQPHFAPRAKNVIYIHLVGGRRTWSCSITSRSCEAQRREVSG